MPRKYRRLRVRHVLAVAIVLAAVMVALGCSETLYWWVTSSRVWKEDGSGYFSQHRWQKTEPNGADVHTAADGYLRHGPFCQWYPETGFVADEGYFRLGIYAKGMTYEPSGVHWLTDGEEVERCVADPTLDQAKPTAPWLSP